MSKGCSIDDSVEGEPTEPASHVRVKPLSPVERVRRAVVESRSPIVVVGLYVLLLRPAWSQDFGFYDDHVYSSMMRHRGLRYVHDYFYSEVGWYRFSSRPMQMLVWLAPDHFSLTRIVGTVCHATASVVLGGVWRRIGFSRASSLVLTASILLFPYALEGVVWPTNAALYAVPLLITSVLWWASLSLSAGSVKSVMALVALGLVPTMHEQLLGIMVVALVSVAIQDNRKILTAIISGSIGTIALLLSIRSTPSSSPRFSGPDRPTMGHLVENLDELVTTYRLVTPFGRLYWDTGLMATRWLPVGVMVGMALLAIWLPCVLATPSGERHSRNVWPDFLAIAGGLAVFAVSAAPGLASGNRWFSPRYMYNPYVGVSAVLAGLANLVIRLRPRLGRAVTATIIVVLTGWGSVAVAAESVASGEQTSRNEGRLASLRSHVSVTQLEPTDTVIVRGVPYTEVDRPLIGEHFIAIARLDSQIALGVPARVNVPIVDFDWNFGGLCVDEESRIGVLGDWAAANPRAIESWSAGGDLTLALWWNERWIVAAPSDFIVPQEMHERFPTCPANFISLVRVTG